ncbi:MAG TPA: helix-turn-helix transcriptional regulator [Pseudonocardiaceae bacterium]|jgi:transcriptional regulator with XRE-family HTH domain|nr:helix-turn-helix transcriptional regulator [Pseudonocardiaceae bacterium]
MRRIPLRRRRLIGALKRLRLDAGLTIAQLAELADFSPSKLSRIEAFEIGINGDDTLILCEAMNAEDAVSDAMVRLARQARRKDWWQVYPDDVLGRFVDYMELEDDSRTVRNFQIDLIPGLLQTPSYIEALIRQGWPNEKDESIDQRVKLRIDRQERALHRMPLWFVIDEAALRRPLGSPEVMAEQLSHLIFMAREAGVTIQILPTDISGHMALGVPFILNELKDGSCYVYLDTLTGGLYVEELEEVFRYRDAWERLSATALDFDRSVAMIRRYVKQHRSASDAAPVAEGQLQQR